MRDPLEYLLSKSEYVTETGCLLWNGCSINADGYGAAVINGKKYGAHRLSYMVHNGPIPDGLHVLHKCDVPSCINPLHLTLGTHSDNMRDMIRKGRGNRATGERNGKYTKPDSVLRGDKHGRALITNDQAETIRASKGLRRAVDLAAEYGISERTVRAIWSGQIRRRN